MMSPYKGFNDINNKGEHEMQVSEGGEGDLHKHKKNCRKNPGHRKFIPIESFSLENLPKGYKDKVLYEYVKAAADLTVKLSVYITSPDRPEFWPETKIPYFLSDMRGKKTLRTGSGKVYKVQKYTDEGNLQKYGRTTCPCGTCKTSDKGSKVWWEILVWTAAHVVVDDIEANHTTLRLFYDREDSELIILKDKMRVDIVQEYLDWCVLSCMTCDEKLAKKLKILVKHFNNVQRKVIDKYSNSEDYNDFVFIVSHPHGCNKQVSIGQLKDDVKAWDEERYYKLTYTTCTCPGSSGAFVYGLGYWMYVHSGSLKCGLNYSSFDI